MSSLTCPFYYVFDYRYSRRGDIAKFAIVTFGETFIIFGGDVVAPFGSYAERTTTIALFSTITKDWKEVGTLNEARSGHGVIVHEEKFVVIGRDHTRTTIWLSSIKINL